MRILTRLLLLVSIIAALAAAGHLTLSWRPFLTGPPLPREVAPNRRAPLPPPRAAALTVERQELPKPWVRAITHGIPTPPLSNTSNILLAGMDTRPWRHRGRTDTLVVVVMDPASDHVGLVSIPRDLLVAVPGHPPNRINTVYATGLREGGQARGVALLRQVVRHAVGLPIGHVVFVDHAGFEALVDALGGVTVTVACPIRDRFLDPRGPGGRLELKLEAGVRHLDGKTALMFARSRHGRGIFDRARRQQALLLGLRERVTQLGAARVRELMPLLRRTVYTDLTALDIARLATRIHKVRPGRIHGLVLGPAVATPHTTEEGRWVLVPDPDAMTLALANLFSEDPPGHRAPGRRCPAMDVALQD